MSYNDDVAIDNLDGFFTTAIDISTNIIDGTIMYRKIRDHLRNFECFKKNSFNILPNIIFDSVVVNWWTLFGTYSQELHYSKLPETIRSLREFPRIENTENKYLRISLDKEKLKEYLYDNIENDYIKSNHSSIEKYRNDYLIHPKIDKILKSDFNYPQLDIALNSAFLYRKLLVEILIFLDINDIMRVKKDKYKNPNTLQNACELTERNIDKSIMFLIKKYCEK